MTCSCITPESPATNSRHCAKETKWNSTLSSGPKASKPPTSSKSRERTRLAAMPVIISMLRAVNVVGHNRIKMEELRALYESLKLQNPQTFIQSGNVVFRTDER